MVRNVSQVDKLSIEKAKMAKIERDAKECQEEIYKRLDLCQDHDEQQFWDNMIPLLLIHIAERNGCNTFKEEIDEVTSLATRLMKNRREHHMTS